MKNRKATLSALTVLTAATVTSIVYLFATEPNQTAAGTGGLTETDPLTVEVFFGNSGLDPDVSGDKVFAVERRIPRTPAVARGALQELLEGPTDEEAARDYFTSINADVRIQRLVIEDGVAVVDFDEQLESRVAGACRVSAIRAQITHTLRQFPAVDKVIISINGRTQDILQP